MHNRKHLLIFVKEKPISMEKYDLQLNKRHKAAEEWADVEFRKLKKEVGERLFSTYKIWKYKDDDYYPMKRAYQCLFEYCDDPQRAFMGINLKYKLLKGSLNLMDSVIKNEYSTILKLQSENEELKRQLDFYKTRAEKEFQEMVDKTIKQQLK